MAPPKRLYKYQSFTTQSLANLKNREVWFSRPAAFNDPFDCAVRVDRRELEDADFERVFSYYKEELPAEEQSSFEMEFRSDGELSEEFRNQVRNGLQGAFEARVRVNLQSRGVACFSERVDDILLWAHYANGQRGFCLEFDTSYEPFPKALAVQYSKAVPIVDPVEELVEGDGSSLLTMVLAKADVWAYEREWRVLHIEADHAYTYPWQALTGIYFGPLMPYVHKEIIGLILRGSPTQLYEVKRSETDFRLVIEKVQYTPFDYLTDPEE